jgi:rhamnosyltransferase
MPLLEDNLKALVSQVSKVFIVDNHSDNVSDIQAYIEDIETVTLICNSENVGVAKALNQLCGTAKAAGYQWILTMDQDSVCKPDMVEHLAKYTDEPQLGIIAPRVEFWSGDQLITSTKNGDQDTVEISMCITSGRLTNVGAWEMIGGFDEWYFIDMVDHEFCTHLISYGYHILRVNQAVLYQRAGAMRYVTLPVVGIILLPFYNEKRNYYICRNSVLFFRKYHRYIRLRHQILVLAYSQFRRLVFEDHRWATIRSAYRGIRDGMRKEIVQ